MKQDGEPTDTHDQLTYTTSWLPYYQLTKDTRILYFIKLWRDRVQDYFRSTDQWFHGYWKEQEVHHGTEHFQLFLATCWSMDPTDPTTQLQFQDAAEHTFFTPPSCPEWFNPQTCRFRSMYLGTCNVDESPGTQLNIPDHFRCIHLALLDQRMRRCSKIQEHVVAYAQEWAEAVVYGPSIPLGLSTQGAVYSLDDMDLATYEQFAGELGSLHSDVDRVENIFASGGIEAFLAIWKQTNRFIFLQAAEKLLNIGIEQLTDPDAAVLIPTVRRYEILTGNEQFTRRILKRFHTTPPERIEQISLVPQPKRSKRNSGFGKRTDQPTWLENGEERTSNPIMEVWQGQRRGTISRIIDGLDVARTYFILAQEAFPYGEHGCSAQSVNAICRGHGRDNHAGMVTAALAPVLEYANI